MKVITEERLLGLRDNLYGYQKDWELVESLIDECRELDTLTVTRLRPMSEAPYAEEILIYNHCEFIKATIYIQKQICSHIGCTKLKAGSQCLATNRKPRNESPR